MWKTQRRHLTTMSSFLISSDRDSSPFACARARYLQRPAHEENKYRQSSPTSFKACRLINNINVCPITKFRDSLKTRTCSISARDIPHFLVLHSSCCRGNSPPREALPSKPDCVRTYLKHHARLLQQICPHVGADDAVASVEADLDVFPKPAAVVVPCRLCVPDGLRDRWQRTCEDSFLALDASQTAQNPASLL